MVLERRGKNRLPDPIASWLAYGLELKDFMHMVRYRLSNRASALIHIYDGQCEKRPYFQS